MANLNLKGSTFFLDTLYRTKMQTNNPKLTLKGFQMTFSIVGNARINGKCGQTWTLTSSMRSAITYMGFYTRFKTLSF